MMQPERRLSRRKEPPRLTYVNLESQHPGRLQDISESGLRFCVIDPLEPSWQVHFWFNANSKRIRGTGELVWTDAARKTGGLRFTHLPEETREQIRHWLDGSSPHPGATEGPAPGLAAWEAPSFRKSNHYKTPAPGSGFSLAPSRSQALVTASRQRRNPPPAPVKVHSEIAPLPSIGTFFQEICRPPFKTICAAVLVMSLTVSSAFYHRQVSEWLSGRKMRTSSPGLAQTPRLEFDAVAPQILSSTGPEPVESNLMNSTSPQAPAIEARFRKPPAPSKTFFVQVAAVRSEVEALAWFELLGQRKLPVFARKSSVDGFYRVLVGPYPDEDSARITPRELERSGYESFIRH